MTSRLAPATPRPRFRWALGLLSFIALDVTNAQARPRTVAAADSAFLAGNVALAESLYYVGARERPRDPMVREALGRFLAAQGKAKVAVVLLEEARMFGGDPSRIATQLAPLYHYLGDWRALLTLPGSPLTLAERKRAAWLGEHPFGSVSDGGTVTLIGAPNGDTIARVAIRIGGRTAVASILGTDIGVVVGTRVAGLQARHFEGDSTFIVLDAVAIGSLKLVNVPATIGVAPGAVTVGAAAFNRLIPTVDYARNRLAFTRVDAGAAESRHMLIRRAGELRVLDRGRWISLGDFAATVAKARKSMAIDVRAGEVRVRP